MTIDELLRLAPDAALTVLNKPFAYAGKCVLALDGDGERQWLFEEDGGMLALSPADDEILFFEAVDETLEPEDGMILFRGKEFEFSYEDAGAVTAAEGAIEAEEEDRYGFSDYESDAGGVVRLVTNENTGETHSYVGMTVVEDDILNAE